MKIEKLILYSIFFLLFTSSLGFIYLIGDSIYNRNNGGENIVNEPMNNEKELKVVSVKDIESEITDIAKKLSPGVVSIVIKKDLVLFRNDPWGFFNEPLGTVKRKVGGGTGFFITKDGIIITNKHVIIDNNADYSIITSDQKEYSAKVLAIDPLTDLAVMKIESDEEFTTLEFIENEEEVNIGQFGIAIGNALAEFQNSVSLGVISGKNRFIEIGDGTKLSGLLQTDAAINPGNSGGPLVDLNGKVVGINTAIVGNSNSVGFSIPLSKRKIKYILESVEKYSEIKKPFIGINYLVLYEGVQERLGVDVNYGAYIYDREGSIVKGSQAEKSGLEAGDIILEVDNKKITLSNDLTSVIQNKIPGEVINLLVLKSGGEQKNIKLELGMN